MKSMWDRTVLIRKQVCKLKFSIPLTNRCAMPQVCQALGWGPETINNYEVAIVPTLLGLSDLGGKANVK